MHRAAWKFRDACLEKRWADAKDILFGRYKEITSSLVCLDYYDKREVAFQNVLDIFYLSTQKHHQQPRARLSNDHVSRLVAAAAYHDLINCVVLLFENSPIGSVNLAVKDRGGQTPLHFSAMWYGARVFDFFVRTLSNGSHRHHVNKLRDDTNGLPTASDDMLATMLAVRDLDRNTPLDLLHADVKKKYSVSRVLKSCSFSFATFPARCAALCP